MSWHDHYDYDDHEPPEPEYDEAQACTEHVIGFVFDELRVDETGRRAPSGDPPDPRALLAHLLDAVPLGTLTTLAQAVTLLRVPEADIRAEQERAAREFADTLGVIDDEDWPF